MHCYYILTSNATFLGYIWNYKIDISMQLYNHVNYLRAYIQESTINCFSLSRNVYMFMIYVTHYWQHNTIKIEL